MGSGGPTAHTSPATRFHADQLGPIEYAQTSGGNIAIISPSYRQDYPARGSRGTQNAAP